MPEDSERVPSTFKLTKRARAILEALAKDRGVGLTHVIELLLREEAERRSIEIQRDTQ